MFAHGMTMLQQKDSTTTMLTLPYSAQTRIVVKAGVRMLSHAYTMTDSAASLTGNREQIEGSENECRDYNSLATVQM